MRAVGRVKSYFLVHEVELFTGFSRYMLDYLAREDIFLPSLSEIDGRGAHRRYSYADVVLLRALAAICKSSGKIRHLKESLLRFRMVVGPIQPGMRIDQLLFVEENELCLRTPGEGAHVLRSGQMLLTAVIDLASVTSEIAGSLIVEGNGNFSLTREAHSAAERIRLAHWDHIQQLRRTRDERLGRSVTKWA